MYVEKIKRKDHRLYYTTPPPRLSRLASLAQVALGKRLVEVSVLVVHQ